jgi:hypothetical protein
MIHLISCAKILFSIQQLSSIVVLKVQTVLAATLPSSITLQTIFMTAPKPIKIACVQIIAKWSILENASERGYKL